MLPQNLCFTIKKMNIPSEFVLKRRKAHKKRVLRRFVVIIMTTYCKKRPVISQSLRQRRA